MSTFESDVEDDLRTLGERIVRIEAVIDVLIKAIIKINNGSVVLNLPAKINRVTSLEAAGSDP
jgi:hypothetical protein